MTGFVSLVGAGPWDPALLTLAGRDRLRRADVVIADYLVNPALLLHCRPETTIIQRQRGPHGGGMSLNQAAIQALLVENALAGKRVVRLKGGDPMVFGRGSEEALVLRAAGIDYEFVPGVSAAIATPQAAGIPITQRDHTPSVSLISGYEAYDKCGRSVGWEHMARHGGTLVLMMSVRNCRRNAERLIASGRDHETPTALVRWGTRGIQQTVVGTLASIGDLVEAAKLRPPAVMVVGSVVGLRDQIQWLESRPLFGKRVVTTRAFEQSKTLIAGLSQLGADVVPIPCLRVEPADSDPLRQALAMREDYDGVMISSPNAVAYFVAALMAHGDVRALAHTSIAAIGPSTTRALAAHGLRPDIEADPAHSEGMVATLDRLGRLQDRWLHVRASTGRPVLANAIAAAGGQYTVVSAYRTVRPPVPGNLLVSLQPPEAGGEGFDAVCFASARTAHHFLANLDELGGPGAGLKLLHAAQARIIAIGPVTAQALTELGLTVTQIARTPSDEGVIAAVQRALGSD